jgi:hypothetical protein
MAVEMEVLSVGDDRSEAGIKRALEPMDETSFAGSEGVNQLRTLLVIA